MPPVPLIGRLDRLRRHAGALAICSFALALGFAVADDWGVWIDTDNQRNIGAANLQYLAGERGLNLLRPPSDRLYGPIFEVPLTLVEHFVDGGDSRSVPLIRYLLTHLFFLASGFAGYLLVWRLFGSRWLALFALLLFLLHPRIYAHSFFNSKDVPFLGMFMLCLWLAHRAFSSSGPPSSSSEDVAGAFALCGVMAGLLTNLRPAGLIFVGLVCFMRVCDAVVASGWRERRRVIASGALFAFASIATYYATTPYLWADPLERFLETLAVMSAHPWNPLELFDGELVLGSEAPPSYLPIWFGITAPPLALLLGLVGFAALGWRVAVGLFTPTDTWRTLFGNTPLRFELLVAACFVVPALAIVVLRPTHYNEASHFFFLWAPLVLLATSGLRTLAEYAGGALRRFSPPRVSVMVVAALATLGLAATALEMARLHPHGQRYFNVLVNTPGAAAPLHERFPVADRFALRQGYAYVLEELAEREEHPDAVFNIRMRSTGPARRNNTLPPDRHLDLFPRRDQRRFKADPNADPDFYLGSYYDDQVNGSLGGPFPQPLYDSDLYRQRLAEVRDYPRDRVPLAGAPFPPLLYERRLYGHWIVRVTTPDLARVDKATANAFDALYKDVTAGTPALRGDIDVYRDETAITWVKEPCAAGELHGTKVMKVVPLNPARTRRTRRADGVRVGAACLWQARLPDYAIAKLLFPRIGVLVSEAHIEQRRRRYAKLAAEPPLVRSTFNLHMENRTLHYVKAPCVRADTEAPFFVHVRPVHLGDLPQFRRRHGFDAMDFRWNSVDPSWHHASGDIFDGVCMATLALPAYRVASIATGQYADGAGLWRVDFAVADDADGHASGVDSLAAD